MAHAQEDGVGEAGGHAVERAAACGGEAVMPRAASRAASASADRSGAPTTSGMARRAARAAYDCESAPGGGTSKGRCSLMLSATAAAPGRVAARMATGNPRSLDRKSTRLNSSHLVISYAVFCLKK